MFVEVYPAAALRCWGLPYRTYKGAARRESLGVIVDALRAGLPELDWAVADDICRRSDDALDAVVCALLARAASLGLTDGPPPELWHLAATEGWIHLPTGPLHGLVG